MITLYIYDKNNGQLLRESAGSTDGVLFDMKDGEDFTLKRPPDYESIWRWLDDKWVADEEVSNEPAI